MDNVSIGKLISKLRKKKKLSQSMLAKKLNISEKAVSKWECGYNLPDVPYLNSLSNILGISTEELLNGKINYINKVYKIIFYFLLLLIPMIIILLIFYFNHSNDYIYNVYCDFSYCGTISSSNNNYVVSIFLEDYDGYSINIYDDTELVLHSLTNMVKGQVINIDDINLLGIKIYNDDFSDIKDIDLEFKIVQYNKPHINMELDKYLDSIYTGNIFMNELDMNVYSNDDRYVIQNFIYYKKLNKYDVYTYDYRNNIKVLIDKYSYDLVSNNLECEIGMCVNEIASIVN